MDPVLVEKMKSIAMAHAKAMSKEMINEIIFKALEAAVANSANKIDDVVLAALEAPLKQAALDMIEKL